MATEKKEAGKVGNPGRRAGLRIADMPERLDKVDQMLRQCWSHSAITALCAKNWGISQRQARNYVKKVYQRWEKESRSNLVDRVHLRRSQLEDVLETAMTSKPPELKVAVAALDRLCRIDGAYAPSEIKATLDGSIDLRARTSNDKRVELDKLLEEYGKAKKPTNGHANGGNGHDLVN